MAELNALKGKQAIDCQDELQRICSERGLKLNIQDPTFNTASIMTDSKRLNVLTDDNSVIMGFSLG